MPLASRLVYGATALAILIPPNTFPGANILDWIGMSVATVMVGVNYLLARGRPARVPPVSTSRLHQPLRRKADHLAQQIGIGGFSTSARTFIISSVIGGPGT